MIIFLILLVIVILLKLRMKYKITPLLIISIGLVLIAIYYMVSGEGGNLGGLVVLLSIFIAGICFTLYYFSGKIFKTNLWQQFIAESLLVVIAVFIYYRINERIFLHLPQNFQGHIIVVWGVEKKPKLKTRNIFSPKIDINVPESGIIFTSNKYGKSIVLVDRSDGVVKKVKPGYGIPIAHDTLRCGNNQYTLSIIIIGKLPVGWTPMTDKPNRNLKKDLACKMLSK